MKDNLLKDRNMVKVGIFGKQEINIQDSLVRINDRGKDCISGMMVGSLKDYGVQIE